MGHRRFLFLLAFLPSIFLPGEATAQDETALFFDTVDVQLVNLEVVVTNAAGEPVDGLTRDDFELYEEGERVEISHFFAVSGREPVSLGGAAADDGAALVPRTRNLNLVLFVDQRHLRPKSRAQLFDALRRFLRQGIDPRDRILLVSLGDDLEIVQPFTADPLLLLAALDPLEKETGIATQLAMEQGQLLAQMQRAQLPEPDPENRILFESAVQVARSLANDVRVLAERRQQSAAATLAALKSFCASLGGLEGRKALVYLSDGLPQRPAEALVEAWRGKFDSWILDHAISDLRYELSSLGSLRQDADRQLAELAAEASASGVAFYPISPGGGIGTTYVSSEFGGAGSFTGRGPLSLDVVNLESFQLESSLLLLADGTGGQAFTRTSQIENLLARVGRDFEHFYSLAYSPKRAPDDAFHRLTVKVRGEGLKVRHLGGYRHKDPVESLQDQVLSALHFGLAENPFGARLQIGTAIPAGNGHFRVPADLQIPFASLLLLPRAEVHAADVTAVLIVRDEAGRLSPFRRIELPIRIPNDRLLEALSGAASYPFELEMRRGAQRIVIGLRDQLANSETILFQDVQVGGEPPVAP